MQTITNKVWENKVFKKALESNPIDAIEKRTEVKVSLIEGK